MIELTTFEDIFNKLISDYLGTTVEIKNKNKGLSITTLITTIDRIYIKPLENNTNKKWRKNNKKTGVIVIDRKINAQYQTIANIPFLLGINTMKAVFFKSGVIIKTFDIEFTIKKLVANQKRLA